MHRFFASLLLIFLFLNVPAQEISISAGPVWGAPFYYQMVTGGAGKSPQTGINFHLNYVFPSDKKITHEVGIGFQHNPVKITPSFFGQPEEERVSHVSASNVILLGYNFNFLNREHSCLSLGPVFSWQFNESDFDKQTGLGLGFSYRLQVKLNKQSFLQLEPGLSVLNILTFADTGGMTERMTSFALNIGWGRSLKRLETEY